MEGAKASDLPRLPLLSVMADLLVHALPASIGMGGGQDRLRQTSSAKSRKGKSGAIAKKKVTGPRGGAGRYQPCPAALQKLIRRLNGLVLSGRNGLINSEREERRRTEERKQILGAKMENARTRHEWETAARELDRLEGNDEWKWKPDSTPTSDYLPDFIEEKLGELEEARMNRDVRQMMYLVRTALSRDLGGMGNTDLYRHAHIGTKTLIERYVDSAVRTIETLVETSAHALPPELEQKDLLEGLLYARQSFGRSALLLSGGATFGMAHTGVLKALFEARLLPRIISGASAGSIVCSVLCTRMDEEIPDVLEAFPHGDLAVFQSEQDSVADHVKRLLTEGSWSEIRHLTRVMRGLLGDMTFQEAYNRTRRICNICVSSASIYELPRLLNYVTAPNVMIWSAVAASCSVPLVFNAAPLLVKDPTSGAHVPWDPTPQRWIDGSVDNDLPMTRLAEMFNVNHFIVSQVNPHVVPFLAKDGRVCSSAPRSGPRGPADASYQRGKPCPTTGADAGCEWLSTLIWLARDEALHRLHFLAELGVFPNLFTKLRSILNQRYSGDITILPEVALQDLPRLLSNPTPEFMRRNCLAGERASWPKLSRVRDRCAIELALDHAVHQLRTRVVFSGPRTNNGGLFDLRRGSSVDGPAQMVGTVKRMFGPKPAMTPPLGSPRTPAAPSVTEEQQPLDPANASRDHCLVALGTPRRRRSSFSNIQVVLRHKRVMQNLESVLTDDDSEEGERLEMKFRRSTANGGTGRAHMSKPRLRRSAKSQAYLSFSPPSSATGLGALPTFSISRKESGGAGAESIVRKLGEAAPISTETGAAVAFDLSRRSDEALPGPRVGSRSVQNSGIMMLNDRMNGAKNAHQRHSTNGIGPASTNSLTSPHLHVAYPTDAASAEGDVDTSDAEDTRTDDSDASLRSAVSMMKAAGRVMADGAGDQRSSMWD